MKAVDLGTQIRQISIITILVGFVSYAFNFVVARVLIPDDAARIMTSWTVINLTLLIVQFPLELYGPRLLRSMAERRQQKYFDALVLVYIGVTACLTFALFLFYYSLRYSFEITEVGIFGITIISSSLFQLFRTINIAKENLRSLVRSSLFLAFGSFSLFSLVFYFDINSAKGPLLATAFGFMLAALMNIRHIDLTVLEIKSIFNNRLSFLEIFSFKEIGALSLSNLVSLLLVPGGAIFTGVVGLTTQETVVYLGSTSLALIPITILNGTIMPIYLRAIKFFSDKEMYKFKKLFFTANLIYFSLGISIVFLFWLLGEPMLLIFLGDQYQYSQVVFTFSSIAVCVAFVGSLSRTFLMAMGQAQQTFKPLAATALMYLTLVLSVRDGFTGLFVASIASSLFVSGLTFLLLQKNIRLLSGVKDISRNGYQD